MGPLRLLGCPGLIRTTRRLNVGYIDLFSTYALVTFACRSCRAPSRMDRPSYSLIVPLKNIAPFSRAICSSCPTTTFRQLGHRRFNQRNVQRIRFLSSAPDTIARCIEPAGMLSRTSSICSQLRIRIACSKPTEPLMFLKYLGQITNLITSIRRVKKTKI